MSYISEKYSFYILYVYSIKEIELNANELKVKIKIFINF